MLHGDPDGRTGARGRSTAQSRAGWHRPRRREALPPRILAGLMMRIDRDPGGRELAVFAAVLPATFALLGLIVGNRLGLAGARNGLWAAGAVFTAAYFVVPR